MPWYLAAPNPGSEKTTHADPLCQGMRRPPWPPAPARLCQVVPRAPGEEERGGEGRRLAATRGGEDLVPATSGKGFPPPVASLGQYDGLSSHIRFFKRRLPIY
jgi:hypothetical protein